MSNSSSAHKIDDPFGLLDGVDVAPPEHSELPDNVRVMGTSTVRLQDMVLHLLLEGKPYSEIATTTGRSVEDVQAIARSEWAKTQLKQRIKDAKQGEDQDILNSLLRIQAFDAVNRVAILMACGHRPTELNACKLVFQYTMAPMEPSKMKVSSKTGLPSNVEDDELKSTYEALKREADALENVNSHKN